MNHVRSFFATVAAFVAGNIGITLGQVLNGLCFPMPEGMDMNDPAAFAAWVQTLPVAAMLGVELSYIVGSLLCGFVGAVAHPPHGRVIALVTGVFFTLANIMNVMAIPHPNWMVVLTMITFVPLSVAGAALGARVRPAS